MKNLQVAKWKSVFEEKSFVLNVVEAGKEEKKGRISVFVRKFSQVVGLRLDQRSGKWSSCHRLRVIARRIAPRKFALVSAYPNK